MPLTLKPEPPYYNIDESLTAQTKIYRATLSQTGTNAPTATVHKNTIGTITLSRINVGQYGINSTALFTTNKTQIFINGYADGLGNSYMQGKKISTSQFEITNLDTGNNNVDGFTNMDVIITVFE